MTLQRVLYGLLGVVAVQRLVELVISRRHERRLLERGAQSVEEDGFGLLALIHTLWFPAMLAEHLWAPWAGAWLGTWPLIGLFVAAEGFRLWAITTLGERWTTRVVVLPGASRIEEGPYRWLDHPNYAAVAVELAALPLAFGLWGTALVASLANAIAIKRRLSVEEAALEAAANASVDA